MGKKLTTSYLLVFVLMLLLDCYTVDGAILGTRRLCSSYKKSRGFLSGLSSLFNAQATDVEFVPALSEVSADFSNAINAFVGPPSSGKSTLAKCIHSLVMDASIDQVDSQLVVNSGEILLTSPPAPILSIYLDPLYYLTYDVSLPAHKLISLSRFDMSTGTKNDLRAKLKEILQMWNIPIDDAPVDMFESQRKLFEIVLSILDAANKTTPLSTDVSRRDRDFDECRDKDRGGDGEALAGRRQQEDVTIVLFFDEYFDKDLSVVLQKVISSLRDPELQAMIQVQTFIITHSKRVMNLADQVVCINAGAVFHQAPPAQVRLPNQLQFIDSS